MSLFSPKHGLYICCLISGAIMSVPSFANQPGRGSDKDIRSAEGAAVQNAEYDKNAKALSYPTGNAAAARAEMGNNQQPGRGTPAAIRSSEGAAVQNAQSSGRIINPDGFPAQEQSKTFKQNAGNPGGMMNSFPAR